VAGSDLRAIYNGEKLSTWEKLAKVSGLDLPGSCIIAKPVQRKANNHG
jgi:hypothetical protein